MCKKTREDTGKIYILYNVKIQNPRCQPDFISLEKNPCLCDRLASCRLLESRLMHLENTSGLRAGDHLLAIAIAE